uniref:Uncharacterized protein n=1 Tax=Ciona savignyi TaxID=51511 RepID=H2Z842_CIOSA
MGSGASKPTSGNKRNDENTVDHVLTALDGCLTKEKPLIEVLRYLDFLHSLVGCKGKMTDVQKNDAVKLMKNMIQRYTDKNKEAIIALCVMTLTWLSPAQDFKGTITESVVELLAKKIKQMIEVETEVGFKIQPAELYNAIAYCATCDDISKIVARSNILDLLHEVVVEKKEGGAEAETAILTLSLTAKNVNLVYDTVNRKVNTWRRLVQNRTKHSKNVQIKDFQVFISCADSIEGKAKEWLKN